MKRLITILVIGLSLFSYSAFSQTLTIAVTPQTVNIANGESVCLDLVVTNFTDMVSMQFSINYDPNVLDFDMAQNYNLPGLGPSQIGNPSAGNITVSWLADDVVGGQDLTNGTSIVQLCFTGITANGTSPITISGTPTIVEVTNTTGLVTLNGVNGEVVVGSGGSGGSGLVVAAPDVSACNGDNVCLEITVQNFTDLVSMQFSINYNSSVLAFDQATGFGNLPGLGPSQVGNPSAGNVTVSWLADDVVNGQTLPNGTVIFELCFDVVGGNGTSSNINFSGTPTVIEVTDVDGPTTLTPDNGSVTVNCGGNPTDGLIITAPDVTAGNGDQVCVDLTVENFVNLVSMQFSINYDPAILEFDMAQGFNLPGLGASQIGNPSAGNITVSWLADDVVNGQTVPDGTDIVELCFTVIGANGSMSPISFSGTPTVVEVTDVDGPVDFNPVDGSVTVSGPVDGLVVIAPEVTSPNGSTVCLDISVENFIDMVSMQFSINYNSSVLQFANFQGFGALPGLGSSQVGNPSPGNITVSWLADDVINGQTLSSPTTIFQVCFTVIGTTGQMSNITFSGTPTVIEVTDVDGPVTLFPDHGKVTVGNACPPIAVSETITPSCGQGATGTISLDASGGDNTYTYNWSNGAGNTSMVTDLAAGMYTVTVSSCGAQFVETYEVETAPGINITLDIVNDVSCSGGNNGSIFLNVQGTFPLSYSWQGTGPIGNPGAQNINNLIAGNYQVTITDPNGCQLVSQSYVVEQPPAVTANVTNINHVDCFGQADGSINVNAGGGTGMLTYNWSGGLPNTPNPTNVAAGNYNLTVVDENNCTVTINNIQVTQPPNLTVTLDDVVNESAAGDDGAISISVGGGSPGYTYLWQGPGGPYITQDLTGLNAGTYNLTVTDNNDCIKTLSVEVDKPLTVLLASVTNACFEENNGAIYVDVSGGNQPYTYNWTGPGGPYGVEDLVGIGGGTYNLTVTDANNDMVSLQVNIVEPANPFTINTFIKTNVSAPNVCDGFITINNTTGGVPPLTYSWSGGQSGPSISNLCVGTYCVTITDANGCTVEQCFEVEFVPVPLFVLNNETQDINCFGNTNGKWQLSIEGGIPPYTFTFSDGVVVPSLSGAVTRNNLPAGPISCTITDSFNPPQELVVDTDIFEPAQIGLASVLIYPETDGVNEGAIDITVSGGVVPFSYLWDNGFLGPDPFNLPEDCFSVQIVDGNGCVFVSDPICVPKLEVAGSNVTDNFCSSDLDGAISFTVGGGINPPLTYTWTSPSGQTFQTSTPSANGLASGTYQVVITDNLGVSTPPVAIEVGFTSEITATAQVVTNYNGVNVSCPNAQDADLVASASNGQAPYSFVWSNGTTGANNPNVGSGTYTLVAIDALGCIDSITVDVVAPKPIDVQADIVPISCIGEGDGEIELAVTGGTPGYSYKWNDPLQQTGNPAVMLDNGIYTVTITDANGCNFFEAFLIQEPDSLRVKMESTADGGSGNGTLTALVTGGNAPYSYDWNVPGSANSSTVGGLSPGEYFVRVTDAGGCSIVVSGFVSNGAIDCLEYRTVITPEGDGWNEEFLINCLDLYDQHRLEIYNRWGQLVFESTNYGNDWKGTNASGEDLPEGAYYFVFEYRDSDGKIKQKKGHITLIR